MSSPEQHGLTSLADDVAATRQLLAELEGPTLLVGHSYGGFVISEAATMRQEWWAWSISRPSSWMRGRRCSVPVPQFPPLEVFQHLLVTAQGLAWIDPDVFPQNFANDLDPVQARALAVSGAPQCEYLRDESRAASMEIPPSWSLFGSEDRMIHPEQHRWMAQRSKATAREISASHVPFLSHPDEVAHIILQAANEAVPA